MFFVFKIVLESNFFLFFLEYIFYFASNVGIELVKGFYIIQKQCLYGFSKSIE